MFSISYNFVLAFIFSSYNSLYIISCCLIILSLLTNFCKKSLFSFLIEIYCSDNIIYLFSIFSGSFKFLFSTNFSFSFYFISYCLILLLFNSYWSLLYSFSIKFYSLNNSWYFFSSCSELFFNICWFYSIASNLEFRFKLFSCNSFNFISFCLIILSLSFSSCIILIF